MFQTWRAKLRSSWYPRMVMLLYGSCRVGVQASWLAARTPSAAQLLNTVSAVQAGASSSGDRAGGLHGV